MNSSKFTVCIFLASALIFGNCGSPSSSENENEILLGLIAANNRGLRVASTKDLAWESNDDYSQNQYGLITTSTLKGWLENWEANKPAHIRGKLVVLQNGEVTGIGILSARSNNTHVYNFKLDDENEGFLQARNNGLVETISIIPDGERMDQILNLYGIDPRNDLIVLTSTANVRNHYFSTLRAFYSLYYWGVDRKNIAVLNGTLAHADIRGDLVFQSTSSLPPNLDSKYSVKNLRVDNTILMLSLQDTKRAVSSPTNHGNKYLSGNVFVSDARSLAEHNGTSDAGGAKTNDTRFMGTLKGAKHIPWQDFITSADGFKFVNKSTIRNLYSNKGYKSGDSIIHLCKTNYRAQVSGFATIGILGYPTTYYDGGWLEWGNIVAGGSHPTVLNDSPFRTDLSDYTDSLTENDTFDIGSILTPPLPNNLATTTRQIQLEDIRYKR